MISKLKTYCQGLIKRNSIIGFLLFLLIFSSSLNAQNTNLHLIDANVMVKPETYIYISGNLQNETDGAIKLNGTIEIGNNIIHNAANDLFIDQQQVPTGMVILSSVFTPQNIEGIGNPIHFPNLKVTGLGKKVLDLNNCLVNNKFIVEAEFDLNKNNFIINNKDPEAILWNTGFIRSESQPPTYGTIQWNVSNNTGTYLVPFGNGMNYTNNLELSLIVETSGSVEGSYTMGTYPTDDFTNSPYPASVLSIVPYQDVSMVDRFWYVAPDFISRPSISLGFSYIMSEIETPNNINRSSLQAIRYNDYQFKWNDWQPGNATSYNPLTPKVLTNSIPRQHQFSHWTLVSEDVTGDIWIPNAFTPDRDEYFNNEDFGPVITFPFAKYEFYVYNRWGQLIFQSEDVNVRWDGTYLGEVVPQGTYAWLIIITKHSTKKYKYNGIVNVVL